METKDLHHTTQLKSKWGPNGFFEIGVDALVSTETESKKAEVSFGWKSSSEQLQDFQVTTEVEMLSRTLQTSFKIQVRFLYSVLKIID